MPPIRTIAEIEVFVDVRSEKQFLYQEIGARVVELTNLGMSHRAIAEEMKIDRNTVWKALNWSSDKK